MDREIVENHLRKLLSDGLGFDLSDSELCDTPKRMTRMYCDEFFCNVGVEFTDFKISPNTRGYNQIIMSDRISFVSMCSHHFLPFSGYAWILYIPKEKLIGASKMARITQHYSCRPQLQETLCHDIINSFVMGIEPSGTMVLMRAIHDCMRCRGVRQTGESGLTTSAVWGDFLEDPSLETKGLELVKISLAC